MKQHLRSLWTLLLLMMWCSVGFAQEVTLDFTNAATDWKISNTANTKPTKFTNGIYTIEANKGFRIQGSGVLLGKEGATLTLPAFDFDVEKIIVIKNPSGGSGRVTQNIFVGTQPVSTQTKGADNDQTYSIKEAFQKAGTIYVLKVTNSNNTQFSKIEIYKKASSKTPTTLTFPKTTINIEEGNEAIFTGQTATLKTGKTELNNAITYTTSNDAMFETYDAKVGPTTLKTGKYGTATVTAKFNGDDTYEASTATYTVNYTEKEKPATTLDFGFTTKTVNIDETFTAAATLKSGETAITGKVTYSSYNAEVAYVDEATGEVLALAAGKTTITATFASTSEYKGTTASYELTVVDPNATEETFDFTKPENYDYGTSSSSSHQGDLDDNGGQIISNGVVITSTSPSTNKAPNRFWKDGLRVYDNSKLVISASGYKIVNVTTEGAQYTWTYNNDGTAVCDVTKATLTSMTVTMSPLPQVTFFENEDNDDALITYDKKTVNTTLTRTLVANKWNTFCVPFETELAGTALEGATVKAVGEVVGNVINLVDATKIEAGVPYLVMPTTGDIVNPTFKSVTITEISAKEVGNDEYKFVGTYSPKKITEDEFGKIWGVTAEGKLAKINANTTMKGLRAYFVFPTNTTAAKLNFDGETTGINSIETNATVNGKVYNLNGQYVGNSLNGLKKGIYVVNGKKVIK